ncbi:MAG: tRNA-dihydrouridine synthase [Planctomycetota bacterium]
MAPMVGLSTRPFRILALRHGCALAAGEMIAAEFLVRAKPEQRREFVVRPAERPSSLQVVGSRIEAMVDAARMLEEFGAAIVDVNMGCPVRKIVRGGGGVALMKNVSRAARIVSSIRRSVSVPVTVKIRAGGEGEYVAAPEFAAAMADAGAAAIAVHARAPSRRHSGAPRLDVLAEVVESVDVPVIGNGGLKTPEDAAHMRRVTGCDAVMFGRGAIGDVWLFERTARFFADGEIPSGPPPAERLAVFTEHLELTIREYGAQRGVVRFRKCVPHYLREVHGAREARHALTTLTDPARIIATARRLLLPEAPPAETAER